MTTIYLVRHGETDWNLARRIQGSTDIPLNQTGRDQAAVTGALLANRSWDGVYASPLARAYETGEIIARELGLPAPEAVPEVAERRYGEAEGLTGDEIDARFPGENIVLVSHGGVIRTILNVVAPDEHPEPIRNGSVHSFRHTDGTLDLIAFDDPIEVESLDCATEDIEDQNAVESRESLV